MLLAAVVPLIVAPSMNGGDLMMKTLVGSCRWLIWLLTLPIILLIQAGRVLGWAFSRSAALIAGLIAVLTLAVAAAPAEAGWFSWLWGDDNSRQHLESANKALQSAAEVVNDASRQQADQNIQLLETIQVISSERTELADHLNQLAGMAARDSEWAAALSMAGPVALAVGGLVVAALALWRMQADTATTSLPGDADALTLLIEELGDRECGQQHVHVRQQGLGGRSAAGRGPGGSTGLAGLLIGHIGTGAACVDPEAGPTPPPDHDADSTGNQGDVTHNEEQEV